MEEPLTRPPEIEEGDNSQAGGGRPAEPTAEQDLADAPDLDEDDVEDEVWTNDL